MAFCSWRDNLTSWRQNMSRAAGPHPMLVQTRTSGLYKHAANCSPGECQTAGWVARPHALAKSKRGRGVVNVPDLGPFESIQLGTKIQVFAAR